MWKKKWSVVLSYESQNLYQLIKNENIEVAEVWKYKNKKQ